MLKNGEKVVLFSYIRHVSVFDRSMEGGVNREKKKLRATV